jgi:hypothetical protein
MGQVRASQDDARAETRRGDPIMEKCPSGCIHCAKPAKSFLPTRGDGGGYSC